MPLEANIIMKSGKVTVIPVQDRDDIGSGSFDFVLRTPLRMTDVRQDDCGRGFRGRAPRSDVNPKSWTQLLRIYESL